MKALLHPITFVTLDLLVPLLPIIYSNCWYLTSKLSAVNIVYAWTVLATDIHIYTSYLLKLSGTLPPNNNTYLLVPHLSIINLTSWYLTCQMLVLCGVVLLYRVQQDPDILKLFGVGRRSYMQQGGGAICNCWEEELYAVLGDVEELYLFCLLELIDNPAQPSRISQRDQRVFQRRCMSL